MTNRYAFYAMPSSRKPCCNVKLPSGYQIKIWWARDGFYGSGLPPMPYMIWRLLDRFGIFKNHNLGVLMIYHGKTLVHRSLVTPKWMRFPEMGRGDMQIGDTWTSPNHRGIGLATIAIQLICENWEGLYDKLWYMADEKNLASIHVIQKCGFKLVGYGERTRPPLDFIFGRFRLRDLV